MIEESKTNQPTSKVLNSIKPTRSLKSKNTLRVPRYWKLAFVLEMSNTEHAQYITALKLTDESGKDFLKKATFGRIQQVLKENNIKYIDEVSMISKILTNHLPASVFVTAKSYPKKRIITNRRPNPKDLIGFNKNSLTSVGEEDDENYPDIG